MRPRTRVPARHRISPSMRIAGCWLSGSLLALAGAFALEGAFRLHLLVAWLIAINVFTFVYYGIDKLASIWAGDNQKRQALKVRIPVASLLLLALAGGSAGALLAVLVFRHKTRKTWFVLRLLLMLVAQVVVVYLLWGRIQPT